MILRIKPMISKTYVVYILSSLKDQSYYVGYTSDVIKRLAQHNTGKSRYTKGHRPYQVVYTESFPTKAEAEKRESYIKKYGNMKAFLKSRVPPNTSSIRD